MPARADVVSRGDDRRRLVPESIVMVLSILIDELDEAPSHVRVELRSLRSRMCRLYGISDPMARANASSVAQGVEDDDGIPFEEAP